MKLGWIYFGFPLPTQEKLGGFFLLLVSFLTSGGLYVGGTLAEDPEQEMVEDVAVCFLLYRLYRIRPLQSCGSLSLLLLFAFPLVLASSFYLNLSFFFPFFQNSSPG